MYTTCSELVVFMYRTGKSMSNLLSYFGLVDARISASEKDLPVLLHFFSLFRVEQAIFQNIQTQIRQFAQNRKLPLDRKCYVWFRFKQNDGTMG